MITSNRRVQLSFWKCVLLLFCLTSNWSAFFYIWPVSDLSNQNVNVSDDFSLKYLIYYRTEFLLFFVFKILPKTWLNYWELRYHFIFSFNYDIKIILNNIKKKQNICFHIFHISPKIFLKYIFLNFHPKTKENMITLLRIEILFNIFFFFLQSVTFFG